jgi:hypothetical protein
MLEIINWCIAIFLIFCLFLPLKITYFAFRKQLMFSRIGPKALDYGKRNPFADFFCQIEQGQPVGERFS